MLEANERHQVVPYLQVQPDWNVITDTVRLFGMMKKIPTSNIPKEFISKGLGGDEIVIKVRISVKNKQIRRLKTTPAIILSPQSFPTSTFQVHCICSFFIFFRLTAA